MQAFETEKIISIVRKAGKFALSTGKNFSVSLKNVDPSTDAEKSFFEEKAVLTDVDTKVQDFILREISIEYPFKMGVVAEELPFDEKNPFYGFLSVGKIESGYTLLLDPIDGTKNFVQWSKDQSGMSKFWALSLCILKGTKPFLGVMHYPALGEDCTIFTEADKGVFFGSACIEVLSDIIFKQSDRGRISTVMGETGRKLAKFLPQDIANPGSFTGTFLALLVNTTANSKIFCSATGVLPAYSFYAGKNIDALDLSCATLAYSEAGGLVCDSSGEEMNPFDFLVKDESRRAFTVGKHFFMLPGRKYFDSLDCYFKRITGSDLHEFLK
ncbi:hypothetical protein JXL83_01190 [candidate division WOR-3 bacterium]|nr:hypothetical protein [candidate division WOR-3 bacterium]